ncbi:DUF84 family protein [Ornithinibacillus halophilus]|uniref:inosine/xanthosine triphosphatase n=1 Tax=Ornithinibacillus halophilus TaxID=930117 RepID=A0A1M5EMI1_9BACI|nr:DUF84 family protein [Ornithinibacillus halophilus]SHF80320.1 inosine/xanthosine triphosphatase [Ornithinibacillus halophilus]
MKIIVGSKNPTKIKAVEHVFADEIVNSLSVPSKVSAQPFSDKETRDGAVNRALQCAESEEDVYGIGLEGGVMYVDNQLFLCNWGALVTPEKSIFTASGARVLLPKEIDDQLKRGVELGDIMDSYAEKNEVRNNEGAIGIFTNNLISRSAMFEHVVTLLRGQWEYWKVK